MAQGPAPAGKSIGDGTDTQTSTAISRPGRVLPTRACKSHMQYASVNKKCASRERAVEKAFRLHDRRRRPVEDVEPFQPSAARLYLRQKFAQGKCIQVQRAKKQRGEGVPSETEL